jgi:hypothetical protein
LELDLRGAEIQTRCTNGCDADRVCGLVGGDDEPLLALYGDGLAPHHVRLLLDSAVAPHAAGLGRLGFSKRQRNAPALAIPVWNVHGERATYQARPDLPRVVAGKVLKYETVAGDRMTLDVPPAVRGGPGNPAVPLFVTEGARKVDAAVSIGLCCIAVLGVWSWRGTNDRGGRTALADWEMIALKDAQRIGRRVLLVFDSDVMQKPAVYLALRRLKTFLESRGAVVRAIYLPCGDGGSKVGLDDFIAAGHDIEDLFTLAVDVLREPAFERDDDRDDQDDRPEVDAGVLDLRRALAQT